MYMHKYIQTDRPTDRQTDRQTEAQILYTIYRYFTVTKICSPYDCPYLTKDHVCDGAFFKSKTSSQGKVSQPKSGCRQTVVQN